MIITNDNCYDIIETLEEVYNIKYKLKCIRKIDYLPYDERNLLYYAEYNGLESKKFNNEEGSIKWIIQQVKKKHGIKPKDIDKIMQIKEER